VPGALQDELPGVDDRRIDASAQNQRHARVLSGKDFGLKSAEILSRDFLESNSKNRRERRFSSQEENILQLC
jgi:hypothetical protein